MNRIGCAALLLATAGTANGAIKLYDTGISAFGSSTPWELGGLGYSTGFEAGDGFAPGYIGGQAGWTTFASSAAEGHIDTANPFAGSQHLRVSQDPALAGGSLVGAFSPDLGPQGANVSSSLSVMIAIGGTGGADYDVVPQAPSQGFLSARVKFSWLGDILILDDTGGGLAFIDTGFDWVPGAYTNLSITLNNSTNTIDYSYGGAPIYSSAAGVFAGTAFEQVVLLSDNWQIGESGDFDSVSFSNVIPSPGGLALLGLAGLAGARRRRG